MVWDGGVSPLLQRGGEDSRHPAVPGGITGELRNGAQTDGEFPSIFSGNIFVLMDIFYNLIMFYYIKIRKMCISYFIHGIFE